MGDLGPRLCTGRRVRGAWRSRAAQIDRTSVAKEALVRAGPRRRRNSRSGAETCERRDAQTPWTEINTGTRSGWLRSAVERRSGNKSVAGWVRGKHLDTLRMLSQCYTLAMRQPIVRAEGLERMVVDGASSRAGSPSHRLHAAPITRGRERRSLCGGREREARGERARRLERHSRHEMALSPQG